MALHDWLRHLDVDSCDIFSMVVLKDDAGEHAS